MCEAAIVSTEYDDRLPAQLPGDIARVESGRPDPRTDRLGRRRSTIKAEAIGACFQTKPAAIAAVRRVWARGVRSIDVGCLQINPMFHPNDFASLDKASERWPTRFSRRTF